MSDRTYRALMGLCLLIVLYFEFNYAMYAIIGLLLFEGLTNLRIPVLVGLIRKSVFNQQYVYADLSLVENPRFNIDSERVWRFTVGTLLFISYFWIDIDALRFFLPWFMGFAIFGAGLSGVCPVLLAIRWLGFR